jgi:2-dehydro-3-deoxygalactonokinase
MRYDVMRGEDVQIFGAGAAGLAPPDALFCQPGTHNKWVRVEGGAITGFTTVMTGELLALLRSGGTLAPFLGGAVLNGPAFRDGIARGSACGGLGAMLFEARAGALLGARAEADCAAFVSGILIGADVRLGLGAGDTHVHMLASGTLAALYATAVRLAGGTVTPIDSTRAFVAGIHALRSAR